MITRNSKIIEYKGFTIRPYKISGEGGWNGWFAPIYKGEDQVNVESPFDYRYKKVVVEQAKGIIDRGEIA